MCGQVDASTPVGVTSEWRRVASSGPRGQRQVQMMSRSDVDMVAVETIIVQIQVRGAIPCRCDERKRSV